MTGPDGLTEPIAVVGIACRLPGAPDPDQFWSNLAAGRESVSFFSRDELRAAGVPEDELSHPDYVAAAPMMPDADRFDADLFGLTAREARQSDPQIRAFLEVCHAALEDAGYDAFAMPDSVGVFGSTNHNSYLEYATEVRPDLMRDPTGVTVATLNHITYLSTFVAHRLDLRGPAITVLTACSSSLVAVHLAAQSLRAGECEAALAGGAAVEVPLGHGYRWTPGSVFTADGHCRPFDAEATGTLFGSGAGAILLKRLDDALAAGDNIRAVIRGSAVNNDGAEKVSFSAPSVTGQAAAVAEAMMLAEVRPADIDYVEAHATGTALGDPVEVAALAEAFGPLPAGTVAIGSVKSNIGHMAAVAGVAGLIKTILMLDHEAIAPTINVRKLNPRLDLERTPFHVATSLRPWPRRPDRARVAGVSSLGIGGTNAHLVVAEGPAAAPQPEPDRPRVVVWSARTPAAEERIRGELSTYFAGRGRRAFADAVGTLQHGRTGHHVRGAAVCESAAEAADRLGTGKVHIGQIGPGTDVVLVFPGQDAYRPRLATGLYGTVREFTVVMDECLELAEAAGTPLSETWHADASVADPRLLVAVQYALARMWCAAGIRPAAVVGHGIGELAASALAGALTMAEAIRLAGGFPGAVASRPPEIPLYTATSALARDLDEPVLVEIGADDDERSVLDTLARLWTVGVTVDWAGIGQPAPLRRVSVPGYPYQRERYWIDPPVEPRVEPVATPYRVIEWQPAEPAGGDGPGGTAVVFQPADASRALVALLAVQRAGLRAIRVRPATRRAETGGVFHIDPGRPDDVDWVLDTLAERGVVPDAFVHAVALDPLPDVTGANLHGQLDVAFGSLLALVGRVLRHPPGHPPPRVVVLTGQSVDVTGAERVSPAKATVHGLIRTLRAENPGLRVAVVDVGDRVGEDAIARELAGDGDVALRGVRRWVPVERALAVSREVRPALRERGVYLLTGGFGGLGLAVARGLAGTGLRPRLVLLGRRDPTSGDEAREEAVSAVEDLRAQGAEVLCLATDVRDPSALGAAVTAVRERFGPIDGMFHLAGVPGGRMLAFRTAADAADVLGPKAFGAVHLAEATKDTPPAFTVYFSSRAGTDGLVGGGDYAAANAFLDAMATAGVAAGRTLSIAWPVWQGPGMVDPDGPDLVRLADRVAELSGPRPPGNGELVRETEMGAATDWVLDEHRVGRKPLLPGTGYLDLLVAWYADQACPEGRAVELTEVVFRAPFSDFGRRRLRAVLRPAGGGHAFVLSSRPAGAPDGPWVDHVTGDVAIVPAAGDPLDIDGLRARLELAGWADSGPARVGAGRAGSAFVVGPRWDSLVTAWSADGSAADEQLLHLVLPAAFAGDVEAHWLHPALLDRATAGVRGPGEATYLPFLYRRLTVHGRLPAEVFAYVRRRPGGEDTTVADIEVAAPDGRLLVRIEGFTMRRAEFVEGWDEVEPAVGSVPGAAGPTPRRLVAGLAPDEGVRLLLDLLDGRTPPVVLVRQSIMDESMSIVDQRLPRAPAPAEAAVEPDQPVSVGALWHEALGSPPAGDDVDFFDAGGDSLAAVDLMARIRSALGVELSVGLLLETRTFGGLRELVTDALRIRRALPPE